MLKIEPTVTVSISTKDRYYTTLPMALMAVANQTRRPKKILVFDDGEQKDLRNDPTYQNIFTVLHLKNIDLQVIYGERKGQVLNHHKAQILSSTDWIWRIDDDDVPEPNVLERLMKLIQPDIGAVGGLVWTPSHPVIPFSSCSGKIEDISTKGNVQWSKFDRVIEVDHLHNTFLYRKGIAEYNLVLSPVGHREETLFTYEIKRKGYKLLVEPNALTWHLRDPSGGIRSYNDSKLWDHDEDIFRRELRKYDILNDSKLIVLDNGIGDHFAFKHVLPELKKIHKKITLALCTPEIFKDEKDLNIISIAEAQLIDPSQDRYNVYKWMWDRNWKGKLYQAFLEMYK